MTLRLILYLSIMLIGALIGYKDILHKKFLDKLISIQSISILILLFVMGIKIGGDKQVISSFFTLGYQALIFSIFSIALSIIFVMLIKRFIIYKEDDEEKKEDEEKEGEV